MPYSELIKKYERVRSYIKDFYIYGFRTRDEFDGKSGRSYDNERRRIESWLGEYIGSRQQTEGKNLFLSIDSRSSYRNPLYRTLKSKSFTDKDITLHFIILDILHSSEVSLTLKEITQDIDGYLSVFDEPMSFDESTVRKKLKEYCNIGILETSKQGRQVIYKRKDIPVLYGWDEALEFFSEVAPLGVIGSYILDKTDNTENHSAASTSSPFDKGGNISFKHHYITHATDSEILYRLLEAIGDKRNTAITYKTYGSRYPQRIKVLPLKIMASVQNGRQHLLTYNYADDDIKGYRLDYISDVETGEVSPDFPRLRELCDRVRENIWGVSLGDSKKLEHVEFTVRLWENEEYIYKRLLREKRCGKVERIDREHCRFSADVYDTWELVPWIRTFICRITQLDFSNRTVENIFKRDLKDMYALYDIGGDGDDIQ